MHATSRSRFRAPWLVVALAAIGVLALAVGVVHYAPPRCPHAAASAQLRAAHVGPAAGEAVFYDPAAGGGSCSIAPLAGDGLYASLPRSRYRAGALCGAYLDITGPRGTVRAEIVDMCPGCSASQLDLSRAAFARIQLPARGTAPVTWQLARDPALPGPLAVRVGPGSTTSLLALQVLNHGNPLSAVSVDGKMLSLRADGYWIGTGLGTGPFQVQVSDTAGNTATLTGITLGTGNVQQTSVLMYEPASPRPSLVPASAPPPPPSSPAVVRHTSGGC